MWSLEGNQQPFSCILGHLWHGDTPINNQGSILQNMSSLSNTNTNTNDEIIKHKRWIKYQIQLQNIIIQRRPPCGANMFPSWPLLGMLGLRSEKWIKTNIELLREWNIWSFGDVLWLFTQKWEKNWSEWKLQNPRTKQQSTRTKHQNTRTKHQTQGPNSKRQGPKSKTQEPKNKTQRPNIKTQRPKLESFWQGW